MPDETTQPDNADTYPNAGRDSGYKDEQGRAIGEDLVNRVTEIVAGVQTSITLVRTDQQKQGRDLDKIVDTLQGIAATITARLGALESLMEASAERQKKLEAGQVAMLARIDTVEEAVNQAEANALGHYEQNSLRITTLEAAFTRLSAALSLSDDAVVTVDADQKITWVNHETLALFGYTAGELIGQHLDILIPDRLRKAHQQHIAAFAQGDVDARRMAERETVHGRHKSGDAVPIKAAISRHADGFTAVIRRVKEPVDSNGG